MSESKKEVKVIHRFSWPKRMGIHKAYHLSMANRMIHYTMIPCLLFFLISLLSIPEFSIAGFQIPLSVFVILFLSPIYLLTDVLMGAVMVGLLFTLLALDQLLDFGAGHIGFASCGLILSFNIQTQIGHRVFENDSRDDTERNISEFRDTLNPIPLVLIFYYHLVEVFFLLGYKRDLQKEVQYWQDQQVADFDRC